MNNKIDVPIIRRRGPPPCRAFGGVSVHQTAGGAIRLGRQQNVRRAELAVRRDTRTLRLSTFEVRKVESVSPTIVNKLCLVCVVADNSVSFSCGNSARRGVFSSEVSRDGMTDRLHSPSS